MVNVSIVAGRVKRVVDETTSQGGLIRIVVVEDNANPQYPTLVPCRFFGKATTKASDVREGDLVRIDGKTSGREHQGKFYSDFSAWGLTLISRAAVPVHHIPMSGSMPAPQPDDDIPF